MITPENFIYWSSIFFETNNIIPTIDHNDDDDFETDINEYSSTNSIDNHILSSEDENDTYIINSNNTSDDDLVSSFSTLINSVYIDKVCFICLKKITSKFYNDHIISCSQQKYNFDQYIYFFITYIIQLDTDDYIQHNRNNNIKYILAKFIITNYIHQSLLSKEQAHYILLSIINIDNNTIHDFYMNNISSIDIDYDIFLEKFILFKLSTIYMLYILSLENNIFDIFQPVAYYIDNHIDNYINEYNYNINIEDIILNILRNGCIIPFEKYMNYSKALEWRLVYYIMKYDYLIYLFENIILKDSISMSLRFATVARSIYNSSIKSSSNTWWKIYSKNILLDNFEYFYNKGDIAIDQLLLLNILPKEIMLYNVVPFLS